MTLTQTYTGRSGYSADYVEGPHQLFVAVECMVGEFTVNALLDTGSQWCILPSKIAIALDDGVDSEGPQDLLSTRFGTFAGHLLRLPLALIAEDGDTVDVEGTWFVSPDWPGPAVIGWKGCLERVRFALDPVQEHFYFGEP